MTSLYSRANHTIHGEEVDVKTTLSDISDNPTSHSYFKVNVAQNDPKNHSWGNTSGGHEYWSVSSIQTITLYKQGYMSTIDVFGIGPTEIYRSLTADEIMRIASHEFGHVLGIDDAYENKSLNRPDATMLYGDDMMKYEYNAASPLSGWDLAMALQAFSENKWQYWMEYSGHTPSKVVATNDYSQCWERLP